MVQDAADPDAGSCRKGTQKLCGSLQHWWEEVE